MSANTTREVRLARNFRSKPAAKSAAKTIPSPGGWIVHRNPIQPGFVLLYVSGADLGPVYLAAGV